MAKKGLKTLMFAYKDIDDYQWNNLKQQNNNFLTEADREVLEEDM
jgi:magnesium-transporting ATPase (P-type)